MKIEINPKYEHLRGEIEKIFNQIYILKDWGEVMYATPRLLPENAEYIYRGGRNDLYRLPIGGKNFIVKDFKTPNIINRYVYTTLRKSKASRSYSNAMKMLGLGFKTPKPVAYIEFKKWGRLRYSFYISEELTGGEEMRQWEEKPNAEELLRAFAMEINRLHKAGVLHLDFSPGNILFIRNEDGSYDFHYVDLNRMKFGVYSRKRLMRMFRSINLKRAETERIARLYAEAAGLDADKTAAEAIGELEGYFAEQKKKKKFKNLKNSFLDRL